MTECILDLYCMTTGTVKLTKMTVVTMMIVTSSTTTTTIIIGTFFSFLLLILLSVYNGHVMMTMLISTLARRLSPKPTTTLQHTHNTVNDISHSECSVVIILHLPWNDILFSPKVQTGSSRLKCRNLNTKQKKSWWDSYLLFEMTFLVTFTFAGSGFKNVKLTGNYPDKMLAIALKGSQISVLQLTELSLRI